MIFSTENLIKILKNPGYLITYKKIRRLYGTPRFTVTHTDILGLDIMAVDSMSMVFMYKEIFEKEIYKFNSDKAEPYIIDCGANIGLATIYFKRLFPNSKILAFEPDDKVFQALQYNISSHGLTDVSLVKKAVWDDEGVLGFYSDGADGGRLVKPGDTPTLQVNATRLSRYLDREVDFLKIDIEGAEFRVLADCADKLSLVKHVFIEYHSFQGREQELDKILAIIKSAGFRYYIEHIGIRSRFPFVERNVYSGMDLQLNIYAYR